MTIEKDRAELVATESAPNTGQRKIIREIPTSSSTSRSPYGSPSAPIETDTLVVISKVKKLIKERSDYSTSQCAIDALTQIVIDQCLRAMEKARAAGRKTVMGRDF